MIPVSDAFREAVTLSHSYTTKIDIYRNSVLVAEDVKFTGGSVTSDRGSNGRLTCEFEVALHQWENLNVDAIECRCKVYKGVGLGVNELLQLGEFRIDGVRRTTSRGTVPIRGVGLENYVIDSKFLTPRMPVFNSMATASIADLIIEALPGAQVIAMNTRDARVPLRSPWDRERWDAVDALAQVIGAEVFVDWSGRFIIKDIPNISNSGPAFRLKVGQDGVIIMPTIESDRSAVYNAVVATAESTDSAIKPAFAVAYDTAGTSPTRWGGPFGKIPGFITSPYLRTKAECQAAANNALALALAKSRTVSLDLLPLMYPEAGDAFELTLEDGQKEIHIIQSITTPMAGGSARLSTIATKTDVGGG